MATQKNLKFFSRTTLNNKKSTKKLFDSICKRKKTVNILTLIQKGADIEAKDSRGYTPLLLASKYGLKTVVNLLINSGAIVDRSKCHFKRTLLHYASQQGWTDIVQSLVNSVPFEPTIVQRNCSAPSEESNFPTIHAKDLDGRTALHLASLRGHLEVVKCLVEKGAVIDARNECGETALHEASSGRHQEVVKYLLDEGADIEVKSCKGDTPLLTAVKFYCNADVIAHLINSGANVDCFDGHKRTVLHYASQLGWIEMVQHLVKRLPVPPFTLDRDGIVSCEGSTCITIHARDMDGRTALHDASLYGHPEIAKFLVEEGADLEVRNTCGETALHEASVYGNPETVKWLVEGGADINVKCSKGVTPLLISARSARKGIVDFLVNSGANLDGCDEDKSTMLHYAAGNGWVQILQSVVSSGANLDARNDDGETALFSACKTGKSTCVEYLLKAGARWDIRNKKGTLLINFYKTCSPKFNLIKIFIEAGVYFMPVDYYAVEEKFRLKIHLLHNVKFCCQAIVNKFNAHDLPVLYKLPVSAILPRIEKMIIRSNSEVARTIEQTVKLEIQINGHCNVHEIRPMVLSLFSVRSILEYYDKNKPVLQKQLKRLAAFDSKNENQHLNKSMRFS